MDLHEIVGTIVPPVAGAATALCTKWLSSLRSSSARPEPIPIESEIVPAAPPPAPDFRTLQFVFSSWLLDRCRDRLTQGNTEHVVAMSGVVHDNICVPSIVCPLKYERVSPVEVVADFRSSHNQLSALSRVGHRLLSILHSHPGTGIRSVHESQTDLETQRIFEEAGYRVIGGVFSRDGFVRFFSSSLPFEIGIYGKGVEEVDRHVYRIVRPGRDLHVSAVRAR